MRQGSMHGREARDLDLLFGGGSPGGLSDGELLDRFVARRDEAAVAALVARHGGMVLGVCRRVLADPHDADDAFQATFLVLARRAGSVRPPDQVARWLHGVALRTARKARSLRSRRRGREVAGALAIAEVAAPPEEADPDRGEWLDRLDRAIAGLPGRYRAPVVLCLLEGRTHREAADLLGWPVGTVSGRLSRARALLARRVRAWEGSESGRGPLALPILVGPPLPPGRVAATARAMTFWGLGRPALTTPAMAPTLLLTHKVARAMTMSKIKLLGMLVLGTGLLIGGGVGLVPAASDQPNTAIDDAPTPDLAPLQGLWSGQISGFGGVSISPPAEFQPIQILVQGDCLSLRGVAYGRPEPFDPYGIMSFRANLMYPAIVESDGDGRTVARRIDRSPDRPRLINLTATPEPDDIAPVVYQGAYQVDGDTLRLALSHPNKRRPARLAVEADTAQLLLTLHRVPGRTWGDQADMRVTLQMPSIPPSLRAKPVERVVDPNTQRPIGPKLPDPAPRDEPTLQPAPPEKSDQNRSHQQPSIQQAARAIADAPEVTPELIERFQRLLPGGTRRSNPDFQNVHFEDELAPLGRSTTGVGERPGADLGGRVARALDSVRPAPRAKSTVQRPAGLPVDGELVAALARVGSWRILRAEDLTKDAMVLKYLPDWDHGDVDNIGVGNPHGGNWTLADWKPIPPDEAKRPSRRFFLAFYARATHSGPKDPGPILASEIVDEWPERVSWRTKPAINSDVEQTAASRFEPGQGWKMLDVTPLIRARGRENRAGRGVALNFLMENPDGDAGFSDYQMVSREGEGEWRSKRPQLLVVEPLGKTARP